MTDKTYNHGVCKGAIALGTGCMRCERCAEQLAARVQELEAEIAAVGAGGVQALSAAPAFWHVMSKEHGEAFLHTAEGAEHSRQKGHTVTALYTVPATPPAEQQAPKETLGGVNGWRDISTAPKDGSRFVATGRNYGFYSEVRHTCVAQWFRGCWMEASDWNETSELKHLTHWMPLPSPPDNATAPAEQQALTTQQADEVVAILRAYQSNLGSCEEACSTGGMKMWRRIDVACGLLEASPSAEQQAQPGAVDRTGCTAGTDEECTRRGCATSCPAQQAAPKAAPGEPSDEDISCALEFRHTPMEGEKTYELTVDNLRDFLRYFSTAPQPAPLSEILDNAEIYKIWFESNSAWHQMIGPKPDRNNHFARAIEAEVLRRAALAAPQQEAQEPDPATFALWYADHIGDDNKPVREAAWETYQAFAGRTAPQPAPAPLSEREYKRGYRDGYERRDAEVRGALL